VKIATIDRDESFLRALAEQLGRSEWELTVHTGPVTEAALMGARPRAVLVDIGLFGPRWDEWLARCLARLPELGLLVCTGPSTLPQRVRGLDAGADDWITKPCHPAEVLARVDAVLRRTQPGLPARGQEPWPVAVGGDVELRPALYDAFVASAPAGLTRREFHLLTELVAHRGEILAREHIYRHVWGLEMAPGDRSIDTFVRKIRNKLQRLSPGWHQIHTFKGIGYSFQPSYEDTRASADPGSDNNFAHLTVP